MVILPKKLPRPKKKPAKQSNSNILQLLCFEQFLGQQKLDFKKEVFAKDVFLTKRNFRFDYYIASHRVAIEVNGGEWMGGRHTSGKGYQTDLEKANLANLNGVVYLQYTYTQLKKKVYENDLRFLLAK